jgi:molybdopterin-guanine dinucleotide biosynthesis protein A
MPPDNVADVWDALVLAGGQARRLAGADKPAVLIGGRTLLDRAVAAVAAAGRVVVVGPPRPLDHDVEWCQEDPPGGGPVAAIAAGLPRTTAEVVVVLAADLPYVAPAVPVLVRTLAESGADLAMLADDTGRANHLAAAWRRAALEAALAATAQPRGAAVRSLLTAVTVVLVPDDAGWGRDCDTWDDVAAARAEEGTG